MPTSKPATVIPLIPGVEPDRLPRVRKTRHLVTPKEEHDIPGHRACFVCGRPIMAAGTFELINDEPVHKKCTKKL